MWGKNDTGQLGIGGSSSLVRKLFFLFSISCFFYFLLFVLFSQNDFQDMFSLETVPTIVDVLKDVKVVDISCSDRHTLACTGGCSWARMNLATPSEWS